MKHFRIIFTIFALFFGATACMQQEKEVFESAENQARKTAVANALQEGNKNPNIEGAGINTSGCDAPTQLVETPITGNYMIFSWTAPASYPPTTSYLVNYYMNGVFVCILNVNATQVTLPMPIGGTYSITIQTVCTSGFSTPLAVYNKPRAGGTVVIMTENLDNFTNPSGTYGSHTYTYSSYFNNNNNFSNICAIRATSLINKTNYSPVGPVSVGVTYLTNSTYIFTTPNLTSNIQNTPCFDLLGNSYLNITLRLSNTSTITSLPPTIICYKENIVNGSWLAIKIPSISPNGSLDVELPNLKRGVDYKIKFFSTYTNLSTNVSLSSCTAAN